jgi:hypothetical protein
MFFQVDPNVLEVIVYCVQSWSTLVGSKLDLLTMRNPDFVENAFSDLALHAGVENVARTSWLIVVKIVMCVRHQTSKSDLGSTSGFTPYQLIKAILTWVAVLVASVVWERQNVLPSRSECT